MAAEFGVYGSERVSVSVKQEGDDRRQKVEAVRAALRASREASQKAVGSVALEEELTQPNTEGQLDGRTANSPEDADSF